MIHYLHNHKEYIYNYNVCIIMKKFLVSVYWAVSQIACIHVSYSFHLICYEEKSILMFNIFQKFIIILLSIENKIFNSD